MTQVSWPCVFLFDLEISVIVHIVGLSCENMFFFQVCDVVVYQIGGGGHVLLLDTSEDTLTKKLAERADDEGRQDSHLDAVQNRLTNYKNNTLPVLKQYDDTNKLVVVSGCAQLAYTNDLENLLFCVFFLY